LHHAKHLANAVNNKLHVCHLIDSSSNWIAHSLVHRFSYDLEYCLEISKTHCHILFRFCEVWP